MPDFSDPELINKYGSWVRVQVAFYDFLFEKSLEMEAEMFNKIVKEAVSGDFEDGAIAYEDAVCKIEHNFPSCQQAWKAFVNYAANLN